MKFVQINQLDWNKFITEVVLNRPNTLNAFNSEMAKELYETFKNLALSDSRVIILRSSTSKAFCTGADLKERNGMSEDEWKRQHELFEQMFYAIADTPQPVIAAVDGYALAGGFEIALNCDFIIASDRATFGLPEVTRGIMPGGGATRLLSKRIGAHIAKEWLCTGRMISAQEAENAGLLNKLTDSDQLMNESRKLAEKIAKNAPIAVQCCKQSVESLFGMDDEQARVREIEFYNRCVNSEDRFEGVRAFVEKREPNFSGK